jgi:hypothetical protein
VLDLDPQNSEFALRLKNFGWKPSIIFELGRISIPLDSVGLRLQICRYIISSRRLIFTYDLVAIPWLIRESGKEKVELTFKGRARAAGIPPGGQSVGTWRMVCEQPDSPSVLRVLHEFLRAFHSIHFVGGFLLHGVRGRSVLEYRTVHGSIADSPLLRVQY